MVFVQQQDWLPKTDERFAPWFAVQEEKNKKRKKDFKTNELNTTTAKKKKRGEKRDEKVFEREEQVNIQWI